MERVSATAERKPPIHLSEEDCERISGLALNLERSSPELAALILEEMERAEVYSPELLPKDVVALNSEVEFVDEATGERRGVQIVLPGQADLEQGRISVMTSVGAGLIGMKAGRQIDWPYPDGRPRRLTILSVVQHP